MLKLRSKVTGAPLTADADPNVTAPPDARITSTPMRDGSWTGGNFQGVALLADGTSASLTLWVFVPDLAAWFKVNATPAALVAKEQMTIANVPPDAQIFPQLTAIVGNPTKFGLTFM